MQNQQGPGQATQTWYDRERAAATLGEMLALAHPPMALAFLDAPPDGVPWYEDIAPAACALWPVAARETFYAPASAHLGCGIGARTLGFPLDEPGRARLADVVGTMGAVGYLNPDEAGKIPAVPTSAAGVLYGPLASFPADPDLILLWINPRGAMLLGEATQAARWDITGGLAVTGRPGCAALPVAAETDGPVVSLGCTGMRARTAIGDGYMLAALPGDAMGNCLAGLEAAAAANHAMDDYYATGV